MTFTSVEPRVHRFSHLIGRAIDMDLTELWIGNEAQLLTVDH